MKRVLMLIICFAMLTGCTPKISPEESIRQSIIKEDTIFQRMYEVPDDKKESALALWEEILSIYNEGRKLDPYAAMNLYMDRRDVPEKFKELKLETHRNMGSLILLKMSLAKEPSEKDREYFDTANKIISGLREDLGMKQSTLFGDSLGIDQNENLNKDDEIDEDVINPGQYKIGIDIPAGIYLFASGDNSGYYSVSKDANEDNIIFNENFYKFSYAEVRDGEYLKINRAIAFDASKKSPVIKNILDISDGMYRIGQDIPAGEYKLKGMRSGGNGYYAIVNARHDITSNDNFDGTTYVTVRAGQYLKLSRALIISAPKGK